MACVVCRLYHGITLFAYEYEGNMAHVNYHAYEAEQNTYKMLWTIIDSNLNFQLSF